MLAEAFHDVLRLGILAGITRRQRWRACIAFVVYLAFAMAARLARIAGFGTPESWATWLAVQLFQGVLALAVAVEIGARIFHRHIQTGRAYTARAVLVVLFLGLLAAITWGRQLTTARTAGEIYDALIEAERRVSGTAMWTFLAVFVVAERRFAWPIDPYHRDIFVGFSAYLVAMFLFSPDPQMPVRLPDSWPFWLYTAVLLVWLRAAWRQDDLSRVDPRYRRLVFPWARHDP